MYSQRHINLRVGGHRATEPAADIDGATWVYLITPTYKRYTQKADLVRMGNTLRQIPNLHWSDHEPASRPLRFAA